MKKRFFLVAVCIVFLLSACESESEIITLDDEPIQVSKTNDSSQQILVYKTRIDKEYLKFLTELSSNYEIIDISTGMRTYKYDESYMVTYKLNTDKKEETTLYKYYLYKTRVEEEYKNFYNNFDFDKYEIVDISTNMITYKCEESYMITYREPI